MRVVLAIIVLVFLFSENGPLESATEQHRLVQRKLLESSPIISTNETNNDLTDAKTDHILRTVNRFRAIIQNSNSRFQVVTSSEANYRKVRYSSVLEEDSKFKCDDDLSPDNFKSDEYTWRRVGRIHEMSIASTWDPRNKERLIDPFNHSILHAADQADTLRMALSPDVTEIGCFEKICNGYKYIACKTGQIIDTDSILNVPDNRCEDDADCTLPGYSRCDTAYGLCDLDPPDKKTMSPFVCITLGSPRMPLFKEKCKGVDDTGNDISDAERLSIVDSVNEYRAMLNNNCSLGLGIPKPASNYRKVKYSCALERNVKFECSSKNVKPTNFISDEKTWRNWGHKNNNNNLRLALFNRGSPLASQLSIHPNTLIADDTSGTAVFVNLFMSQDVTEVGCFAKVCDDHEYIACTTNHNHAFPLYTPGQRCNIDADCTLPGYRICDTNVGLCDYKSHYARRIESYNSRCADPRNVYIERATETCTPDGIFTGSVIGNKEREIITHTVNQFRALVNNECNLGKGNVKPVSNYRKVKYSCTLEKEAKFDCSNVVSSEFKSDMFTMRLYGKVQTFRKASFVYWSPYNQYIKLDPDNQTIKGEENVRNYAHLMMSPEVTEIGCFIKICGEYEYMACKTGHVVMALMEKPLYTPGKRCTNDDDCTLPGYNQCDVTSGLCESNPTSKSQTKLQTSTVSPLICYFLMSPHAPLIKEKCNGIYETGSAISRHERNTIVSSINEFRAMLNNNCTLGLGVPKPVTNYRKVKYSCSLEIEAMFECSLNLTINSFTSSGNTWQSWGRIYSYRNALFHRCSPTPSQMFLHPDTCTVKANMEHAAFLKFFLSPDVTEVGCYVKVCLGYEFIACKTNHNHNLLSNSPLYTPGKRCNVDSDCTLPGYTTCDASVGLCDFKNQLQIKEEALAHKCENLRTIYIDRLPETCSTYYDTGSDVSRAERDMIVYVVNLYRKFVNNNCDLGSGIVKPITNYRKVKYSCALEADAKFECSDDIINNFQSDSYTLRDFGEAITVDRKAVFYNFCPYNYNMFIDPDGQTSTAPQKTQNYIRLMLSPEVTEIGCFHKLCGSYEFMACKTGHTVVAPEGTPFYKPGNRCLANSDCTLSGYGICDIESGLCESF